ncbi:peptidase inhibitor family I36 protein [Promicromonospora sp. AC04]|uniref:peptidase inhibitor family I36 protein n=1 Tax=Promicromonospora sp. AC04 TaxID=2135723 RepID=UPI0018EEC6B0|nr:peptidase inhibitor family I36 protein [Promicromonospora sp. AC04]
MRRASALLAVISLMASMLGLVVGVAAPASAAARDGVCDIGEFCYYYNSDNAGSISDFAGSVSDYATTQPSCYDFKGAGAGQGECIKNNAASVWNRTGETVRVYYNTGYGGEYQNIGPGYKGQLNEELYNNNASHQFVGTEGTDSGARSGTCESGEFCYYYNSGNAGSISDFTESAGSYGDAQPTCYDYKGAGAGQGECIKNNAASVWNRSTKTVRVYYNSNYAGTYQDVAPGFKGQLNSTLYNNNNASHQFVGATVPGSGSRSGTCESGELCYYYNSGNAGSISDFTDSVGDYGTSQPSCYDFKGAGAGQGECIKNNAASVWNRSSKTVCVYFNSYYGGSSQAVAAGFKGQLNGTLNNNNASHRFITGTECPVSEGGGGDTSGDYAQKVERVIQFALSQTGQGLTYSWGGGNKYGPTYGICCSPGGLDDSVRFGFDCSGLTQYAFWQGAGLDIGTTSRAQVSTGTRVSMSNLQRGDLIMWGGYPYTHHVAIYLGNGQLVEANVPRTSTSVHVKDVYGGDFGVRVSM